MEIGEFNVLKKKKIIERHADTTFGVSVTALTKIHRLDRAEEHPLLQRSDIMLRKTAFRI